MMEKREKMIRNVDVKISFAQLTISLLSLLIVFFATGYKLYESILNQAFHHADTVRSDLSSRLYNIENDRLVPMYEKVIVLNDRVVQIMTHLHITPLVSSEEKEDASDQLTLLQP